MYLKSDSKSINIYISDVDNIDVLWTVKKDSSMY